MRLGSVSETIMQRSLLKQLPAGVKAEASEDVVFSDVSLYGEEEQLGTLAIDRALNEILIEGARPIGVNIEIMMPPGTEEESLRDLAGQLGQGCERWRAVVLGIRAEVNPVVRQTIVNVTAIGKTERDGLVLDVDKPYEQDIILTKWIGMEGTLRILAKERNHLSKRFVAAFLHSVESWREMVPVRKEAELARSNGVKLMRQVTEGGIYAALWYLAKETGTGLEVRMKDIPIRQETVEICEYFRINPYQLTSSGSLLMLSEDGEGLIEKLAQNNIPAVIIGRTTRGNDKVILRGEERRFLDRPAPDELLKLYSDKQEGGKSE